MLMAEIMRFLGRERRIHAARLRHEKVMGITVGLILTFYVLAIIIGRYDFLGWFEWLIFYITMGLWIYTGMCFCRAKNNLRKVDEWLRKVAYKKEKVVGDT